MATVKKEGQVKETMGKMTHEELVNINDRIDEFDNHFGIAQALLEGCYGIVTSEMCGDSQPAVESLIYEIEDHMKEIKKIFKEVTGQNKPRGLKEIEDNISEIQKFTLSHTLKKKVQKKIDEVIGMIEGEKKRQKIA